MDPMIYMKKMEGEEPSKHNFYSNKIPYFEGFLKYSILTEF